MKNYFPQSQVAMRPKHPNLERSSLATSRADSKPSSPTHSLRSPSPTITLKSEALSSSRQIPLFQDISYNHPSDPVVVVTPFSITLPARTTEGLSPITWSFPNSEVLQIYDDEAIDIMDHDDGIARGDGFKPLSDSTPKRRSLIDRFRRMSIADNSPTTAGNSKSRMTGTTGHPLTDLDHTTGRSLQAESDSAPHHSFTSTATADNATIAGPSTSRGSSAADCDLSTVTGVDRFKGVPRLPLADHDSLTIGVSLQTNNDNHCRGSTSAAIRGNSTTMGGRVLIAANRPSLYHDSSVDDDPPAVDGIHQNTARLSLAPVPAACRLSTDRRPLTAGSSVSTNNNYNNNHRLRPWVAAHSNFTFGGVRPSTAGSSSPIAGSLLPGRFPTAGRSRLAQDTNNPEIDDEDLFVIGSASETDDENSSKASTKTRMVAPRTSPVVAESSRAASQRKTALMSTRKDPEPGSPARHIGRHQPKFRPTLCRITQGGEATGDDDDRRYLVMDASAPAGSSIIPLADIPRSSRKGKEPMREVPGPAYGPAASTTGPDSVRSAESVPEPRTSPTPETAAAVADLWRGPVIRYGPLPLAGKLVTATKFGLSPPEEIRQLWPGIDKMRKLALAMSAITGVMLLSFVSSISVIVKGIADGEPTGNGLVVWATLSGVILVSSGMVLGIAIRLYAKACRRAEDSEDWISDQHLSRPLPPRPSVSPCVSNSPDVGKGQGQAEGGGVVSSETASAVEVTALPRADTQASILTMLCAAVTEGTSPLTEELRAGAHFSPPSVSRPGRLAPRPVVASQQEEEDVEMF